MVTGIANILKGWAKSLLAVEEHGVAEVTAGRMAICEACPNYDARWKQCETCGCYMEVKTPLLINRNPKRWGNHEITHCPIGKWGDLDGRLVAMLQEKGVELPEWTDKALARIYHEQAVVGE